MNKIVFLSQPGLENFVAPVAEELAKRGHQTTVMAEPNDQKLVDAVLDNEIIWIEWGNELARNLTTDMALLNQRNVILRLHSYEAFMPWIHYINWDRVDHLIFVAKHIKDLVLEQVPKIEKMVGGIHVIPNGVDLDKFPFVDRPRGKKIAYIGYLNYKKGPMLLLHAFHRLTKIDKEFKLYIAGKFQEPRYELYFKQFIEELDLQDKVIFNGWITDMNAWLKDKNFVVSSSLLESQGMGIMEAMATGCKPLIHNFYGATNVYPRQYLWTTIDEFVGMAREKVIPASYRSFVENSYSINKQMDLIEGIIKSCESKIQIHTDVEKIENVEPVTLTVAMMVKDESKNLDRCLSSVKDFADEIVVVDTGSSDDSMKICKRYGAKLYEHPWENFSVHRNQSIGYSTMDWILIFDADEEFVGDGHKFKKGLAAVNGNCNSVKMWLHDINEDGGVAVKNHPVCVFKNGAIHYEGSVHNEPIFDKQRVAFYKDAHINHYGYHAGEELKRKKSDRTIGLLEKELIENPGRTKVLFYLFQSYCNIGQIEKGLSYGEQYLTKRDVSHDFNDSVFFSMVTAYLHLGNINRARQLLDEGLRVIPNDIDLAMAMIELGVAINDGYLVVNGAAKYLVAYNYMIQNPSCTGIRFVYSFRPDTLAYVLHRAAMCHFQNGAEYTKKLNKAIETLDNPVQQKIRKEFRENLALLELTETIS